MTEVHLKQDGSTNYIIPAGYMNRALRRKLKKKGAHIWRIR